MAPRLISYAQNGEDMVLWHAFADVSGGFFVDVGANEPTHDSVTKHFYDRGWSGINIEPQVDCFERLTTERSRDINLNIGIGETAGALKFHLVPDAPAMSTFSDDQLRQVRELGYRTETRTVQVRPLSEVFAEHVGERTVDFLKVDVEGLEQQVLGNFDWARWQPRVVLVESHPEVSPWEEEMLAAGYRRMLWDGINLFFVRELDLAALGPAIAKPATIVLDRFDPWLYVEQLRTAQDLLESLMVDHLAGAMSARTKVGGPDPLPAARALGRTLSRRRDVVEHFGGPPGADISALLAWAGNTEQRAGEEHADRLTEFAPVYRALAFAPVRTDAPAGTSTSGSSAIARVLGRLKQALPAGARSRLGKVRRRIGR